jgi:tRNA nucleotidyltransferase (CCA-adding enzyme)
MKMFDKVEGKRLLNEMIHMLEERNPLSPLTLMAGYGILKALHPSLSFSTKTKELVEAVFGVLSWWKFLFMKDKVEPWQVYFYALTDSAGDQEFAGVLRRFSLPEPRVRELEFQRAEMRRLLTLFARGMLERPSWMVSALKKLSPGSLLFMMAKTTREQTRMSISDYITNLRLVAPLVTGSDLRALGYTPGPIFGSILGAIRDARLDGLATTKEQELELVKRRFPLAVEEQAVLNG